jgi:GNAT superfamily N-acetyltransferase
MINCEWVLETINKKHHRSSFDCGEADLNNYLKRFARQNAKNNISQTFVIVSHKDDKKILGFYSFSVGSIEFHSLPQDIYKRLPKYPIPIARLSRLAVDKTAQGKGLGEWLVMDAFKRCVNISKEIGIFGLVVDAKHERAKKFYFQYGFHELTAQSLTLFIPTKTITDMIT